MKDKVRRISLLVAGALVLSPAFLLGSVKERGPKSLDEQVRHALVMLPYYNVFDNLAFSVNGPAVTLTGEVTRPALKSEAENVVKALPGVESVKNEITVLPLSYFDDVIRVRAYRAIYGQPALSRYALGTLPSIRIIVNNGKLTLDGVVNSEADKNIAYMQANSIPGVFSVTNNLQVAKG